MTGTEKQRLRALADLHNLAQTVMRNPEPSGAAFAATLDDLAAASREVALMGSPMYFDLAEKLVQIADEVHGMVFAVEIDPLIADDLTHEGAVDKLYSILCDVEICEPDSRDRMRTLLAHLPDGGRWVLQVRHEYLEKMVEMFGDETSKWPDPEEIRDALKPKPEDPFGGMFGGE